MMSPWLLGLGMLVLGTAGSWGLEFLIARERRLSELPPTTNSVRQWRPVVTLLVGVGLCALLGWWELVLRVLDCPEVQPSDQGRLFRAAYHGLLVWLMVWGTVIDLDCYILPEEITLTGLVLGVAGAVTFQELQIAHLWVDWIYAVPGIRGPYIPEWYDQLRWLHALSWSLCGAIVGGALTQVVRLISSRLLGQEAMGFGDVTFMAMIGSFLGWQGVVLIFGLAPLTGLVGVMINRAVGDRNYLPYGPCLAVAAYLVMLNWSSLWQQTRMFFSDLWLVAGLAVGGLALLVLLLGGLQVISKPQGRRVPP